MYMNIKKLSTITLLLWSFIIVFLSSVSTTIFSESAFNDNFAFTTMAIGVIGFLISALFLVIDTVQKICNP